MSFYGETSTGWLMRSMGSSWFNSGGAIDGWAIGGTINGLTGVLGKCEEEELADCTAGKWQYIELDASGGVGSPWFTDNDARIEIEVTGEGMTFGTESSPWSMVPESLRGFLSQPKGEPLVVIEVDQSVAIAIAIFLVTLMICFFICCVTSSCCQRKKKKKRILYRAVRRKR